MYIYSKTVRLFNCDNLYPLQIVEDLLREVEEGLTFKLSIERHVFRLAELRQFSQDVKTMDMDYAVFVVHANESRLSINEENAGIGYGRLFKELLEQTDGKVLVVIGGDTHYQPGEEERRVISDWAMYKVSSQFPGDSMDGRKSFVFSWKNKHNPLHVFATKHFFKNEGIKFDASQYLPRPPQKVGFHEGVDQRLKDAIRRDAERGNSPPVTQRYNSVPRNNIPPVQSRFDNFEIFVKRNAFWIAVAVFIIIIIIVLAATL